MSKINKSFGSVFGTGISAKQGIVQDLSRLSNLGTLSHLRRTNVNIERSSKFCKCLKHIKTYRTLLNNIEHCWKLLNTY